MDGPSAIEIVATTLFAIAVLHTFATRWFERLARLHPAHAGLWHLLGELEIVFGFWAFVLVAAIFVASGGSAASQYLRSLSFLEPMFVFVIMVVAASRPVMQLAADLVGMAARALPASPGLARYFVCLAAVPLLGSLITEPAAMTLAALMLRETLFARGISLRLRYATLGVLFVNVSIGGTLTHFAAPPVLMVAGKWGWTTPYIFSALGWKAAAAVVANAALAAFFFRRELGHAVIPTPPGERPRVPGALVAIHVAMLALIVAASHERVVFMGLFLLFLGLADAYERHHDRLMIREGLLVGFFLAGLVVLGGLQRWWLQPTLSSLEGPVLFVAAAALTSITDNAALTYLGSLVEGTSDAFRYALVAGAVTGGGLTVIANAPNPAGFAILKDTFEDGTISPWRLLLAALAPTGVAALCLWDYAGR